MEKSIFIYDALRILLSFDLKIQKMNVKLIIIKSWN